MALFTRHLHIDQGATFRLQWIRKAGATAATAVVVDLTGYTARMQIRQDKDATTVLHELTTANGGIALDADGSIELVIDNTDTAAFDWDAGVYDLELIKPDGDVIRYAEGRVRVNKEVTR